MVEILVLDYFEHCFEDYIGGITTSEAFGSNPG
jgi:hypothetical protein